MSPAELSALEREDRRARVAAQTVFDRPVVLEAGAGTGKTTALVGRVAAWALGGGWERAAVEEAERLSRTARREADEAERVAARVLDGTVAITFTEAAAAEMAERVALGLRELTAGRLPVGVLDDGLPADPAVRAQRAQALLAALDHLRVSTIHAFCRRLLAANPLEAGLHPAFVVDADERLTEATARAVVEERYREALAGDADADVITLAAVGVGPSEIVDAILKLRRSGGVPAPAFGDLERWTGEAGHIVADLAAAARDLGALVGPHVGGARQLQKAREVAEACERLAAAIGGGSPASAAQSTLAVDLDESILDRLGKWSRHTLTQSESAAFGPVAAQVAEQAGRVRELARVAHSLDLPLFAAGARVVGAWLEETGTRLRREGIAGFGDLLHGCRDLLVSAPAVARRERRAIRQLLVDEFQDTDAVQCEILAVLALAGPPEERPGLFLVGDPKQSIYGWRNADLAAYQRFVERVLGVGGEAHRLSVNFRSVAAILAEVERGVRPAMRPVPGLQPAFEPLVVGPTRRGDRGFDAGGRAPVEYWLTPALPRGGGGPDPADLEPQAVAADIRELHDRHGVAWAEFAILMRAATELDAYLHALREESIPYLVERDRSYYRRREIIDASALIRTVLDPLDHLALLAWLRSAAVGVPDAALIPLWERRFPELMTELRGPDPARMAALGRVIDEAAAATPAVPGLERVAGWAASLVAAVETLAALRESFSRDPAPVVIERLRTTALLEGAEAARFLGRYRVANLDRLFRSLLEEVDRQGAGPEAMLGALRRAVGERRDEEEGRLRDEVTEAVRVLTIHKAKGLDFGHVYLVDAGRREHDGRLPSAAAELVDGSWELALFGLPTPGWRHVAARRRRVAEAELVRTLYVAMTRAKRRLVIAGRWEQAGEDASPASHVALLACREGGVPEAGALGDRHQETGVLWVPLVDLRAEGERTRQEGTGAALPGRAAVEAEAQALRDLATDAERRMARPFSAAASSEAHRRLREEREGAAADDSAAGRWPSSAADGEAATRAGSAVHLLLERLDLDGDIRGQIATWPGLVAGLLERQPEAARRAVEIVERFRASRLPETFAAVAGAVIARELPVLLPPDGRTDGPVGFVSGIIDLVYRDPGDGGWVIVDYKTDRVESDHDIVEHTTRWALQGAVYTRALREALSLPTLPRFELWFLWPGRAVAVPPAS